MTLEKAFEILEIDETSLFLLKEQYRWLVWFYHPDNTITGGNSEALQEVVKAYQYINQTYLKRQNA
jgi:hypothetical protein